MTSTPTTFSNSRPSSASQASLELRRVLARDAIDILMGLAQAAGAGLSRSDAKALLALMTLRFFGPGERIALGTTDLQAREIRLVLHGEASLVDYASASDGRPLVYATVARGSFLGLTASFSDEAGSLGAIVVEDLALAVLPVAALNRTADANPLLATVIQRVLMVELAKIALVQTRRAAAMAQVASSMRDHIGAEMEPTRPAGSDEADQD